MLHVDDDDDDDDVAALIAVVVQEKHRHLGDNMFYSNKYVYTRLWGDVF
jgi:hypothetical protein